MHTNTRQLCTILLHALEQAPEEGRRAVIARFVAELAKDGSLDAVEEVVAELESGHGGESLEAAVAHGMTIPGAHVKVEPKLVAGARLRRGDVVSDATVQGRLHTLRNKLAVN